MLIGKAWWRSSRDELAQALKGHDFGWSLLTDPRLTRGLEAESRAEVGAGQLGRNVEVAASESGRAEVTEERPLGSWQPQGPAGFGKARA